MPADAPVRRTTFTRGTVARRAQGNVTRGEGSRRLGWEREGGRMRRMSTLEMAPIVAALSVLAEDTPAAAQASFTAVAPPAGQANAVEFQGVSADGGVGVGIGVGPLQAFRWTATSGVAPLGHLVLSDAFDVSGDGTVIVGIHAGGFPPALDEAFRWTQSEGIVGLGELPGGSNFSRAVAISDDGTTITGQSNSAAGLEAFRWTAEDGMVGLGIPSGMGSTSALGISPDGSTIVGGIQGPSPNQYGDAFYWTEETGMVGIGTLDTVNPRASGRDDSADGSVIVGQSGSSNGLWEAFRWTAAGGMVGLGDLPGGTFQSFANGVSGDGTIVVGESTTATGPQAFIWDAVNGMRFLTAELEAQGVDMTGWRLTSAQAISTDGTTIVGYG